MEYVNIEPTLTITPERQEAPARKKHLFLTSDFICVILMFFYIFYFRIQRIPVLSSLDSTLFVGGFLLIIFGSNRNYREKVNELFFKKYNLLLAMSIVLTTLIAALIATIHKTLDFTICRPLFHQLLFIVIGIFFYAYFMAIGKEKKVLKYIIYAYVVQTFIQYLAFLIPPFGEFTNIFKTEDIIILKQQYDGFRLNAISGGLAFSLAGAYAIVTLLLIFRWRDIGIKHKFITLMILLAGSLVAGRTALLFIAVGSVLFFIVSLYKGKMYNVKMTSIGKFLLWMGIVLILALLAVAIIVEIDPSMSAKLDTITVWLTKWQTEYFRSGNYSNYDFWETNYGVVRNIDDLITGDGFYTNADGTYYLRQDAGFVRILGFGGIFWLVVLLVHQTWFFRFKGERLAENLIIYFLLLLGTLKADCLGIDLQIFLILILVLQYDHRTSRKEVGHGQ